MIKLSIINYISLQPAPVRHFASAMLFLFAVDVSHLIVSRSDFEISLVAVFVKLCIIPAAVCIEIFFKRLYLAVGVVVGGVFHGISHIIRPYTTASYHSDKKSQCNTFALHYVYDFYLKHPLFFKFVINTRKMRRPLQRDVNIV